ncbi:serine/threonine-protein kinase SBK1-like [Dendropsophus ebraccatus]|uniref:serine/threonine-protein kinase SBK1-like n=1 Tax=Dendropsophus ebraccatus TaxID=150705 RepID=UPI0038318D69
MIYLSTDMSGTDTLFMWNHLSPGLQRLLTVHSCANGDTKSRPMTMSPQSTISTLSRDIRLLPSPPLSYLFHIGNYWRSESVTEDQHFVDFLASRMASQVNEITKNMAKHLLHLVSETAENLRSMEVTDHFDILQELGEGSFGKVLMGKHKHSGQVVALKLLRKERTQEDNFLLEYGVSLTLSCHPHIILTHQIVFQTGREFVLIQEVAPAGNLQSIIKPKVGMQEDMVKRCVPQIASALDFLHNRGMVHRDIKPNNVLLMDFECHRIKLADFGLTRLQGTYTSSLSRFVPYNAPELCRLRKGEHLMLHPSLDVWAFGVLVYFALTGFFPWRAAQGCDPQYKEFAWWQVKRDVTKAPEKWKEISVDARAMFWDLFALNASERGSAMDVMKYMQLPWKLQVPS